MLTIGKSENDLDALSDPYCTVDATPAWVMQRVLAIHVNQYFVLQRFNNNPIPSSQ